MEDYEFEDVLAGSTVTCGFPGLDTRVAAADGPRRARTLFFPGCSLINYALPLVKAVYDLLAQAERVEGISLLCCGKILSFEPDGKAVRAAFEDELCAHVAAAGVEPQKLPPLVECGSAVGGLLAQAARELGLPAGVPVERPAPGEGHVSMSELPRTEPGETADPKPVGMCGDFNVAHQEIDLKHPGPNRGKAGFSDEERGKFTDLLEVGFVDSFRHLHPDVTGAYSWWSYRFKARQTNAGWRIDYFLVSDELAPKIQSACIYDEVYGSDHCPVGIELEL